MPDMGQESGSTDALDAISDPIKRPMPVEIRDALREQILSGQLPPGRRIVQENVASSFATSRIPVREALRLLAAEGLVEIEPDVGARVAPLNPDALHEVYLMREALEPLAVRASVPNLTPTDLDTMTELVEEGERLAAAGDVAGYMRMDAEFHELMVMPSGLMRLRSTIHQLWDTTRQYRAVYSLLPSSLRQSNIEHRGLLEACERHAAEDAADLHRVHIRRTRLTLDDHPEWFTARADVTG